jgi:hypothetical protein
MIFATRKSSRTNPYLVQARESLTSEKRTEIAKIREKMLANREKLNQKVQSLRVKFNDDLGAPEVVGTSGRREFLTAPSNKNPENVLRDFMKANKALYGLKTEDISQFETHSVYTNPDGKRSHG